MIIEMYKCLLTGLRADFVEIASSLKETQALQVSEFHDSALLELTSEHSFTSFHEMITLRNKLEILTNQMVSIEVNLPEVKAEEFDLEELPKDNKKLIKYCETRVNQIEPEYRHYRQQIDISNQKIRVINQYRSYVEKIKPLVLELAEHHHYKSTFVFVDRKETSIDKLVKKLKRVSNNKAEIFTRTMDDRYTAFIILTDDLTPIHNYISENKVSVAKVPDEFAESNVKRICIEIDDKVDEIENEIIDIDGKIRQLAVRSKNFLKVMGQITQEKIVELSLADNVKLTEFTFSISGYVPKTKVKLLKEKLTNDFGEKINIIFEKVDLHDEEVPILRKNLKIAQPFSLFTDLLSRPTYGEFDPVIFVAILWPFYWGFMVGDIGYGLLAILVGLGIRKFFMPDSQAIKQLGLAFIYAGIFTIIFGIIYGELFGDILTRFEIITHDDIIFDRYNDMEGYLILSLVVAFICMIPANIIGVYNGRKLGHKKHFFMSLFTLIMLFSILGIIAGLAINDLTILGIFGLLIVICAIVFTILEGIEGIIHTIEVMTNILSFARLMAIGMVGIILANIGNIFMFGALIDIHHPSYGVIFYFPQIIGIIVGLFIHILNFAIIILSPSIQALRLNLVELMQRFYEGGGKEFKPFGKKETVSTT